MTQIDQSNTDKKSPRRLEQPVGAGGKANQQGGWHVRVNLTPNHGGPQVANVAKKPVLGNYTANMDANRGVCNE